MSSRFGKFPPFKRGYISFNIIAKFSTACIIYSSLYVSSISGCAFTYIAFNAAEIVIAILFGSSYINGFNPIEPLLAGSIILYFIWKFLHTFIIFSVDS